MFLFWLARELGMTVNQLLNNIDSKELIEWQIFFELMGKPEKFGKDDKTLSDDLKKTFLPIAKK